MVSLQKRVQNDKSIPFGSMNVHPMTSMAGPARDRQALQTLGEGGEVVLTGFVKVARQEGAETVNCGRNVPNEDAYHDIHISVVAKPSYSECTSVVVEMSPHHRPKSWTADLLNAVKTAELPVRVTGQLMFDSSHSPCANDKAVAGDPARASLWEVHPVYKFEVCTRGDCSSGIGWMPVEEWKSSNNH
jgi:hypothetical protein